MDSFSNNKNVLYTNLLAQNIINCPGQDVKRYPSCVLLDDRKVFSCTRC